MIRCVVAMCMAGVLASTALGAPVTKNDKTDKTPVGLATAALVKEYQAATKDPNAEAPKGKKPEPAKEQSPVSLRTKSDYFSTTKVEGVTADAIVAALEKPIVGVDPRGEAYVKWQLMSGLDPKVPDALVARVVKAYAAAPAPIDHPGNNHAELNRALQRFGINKKDAEGDITKELTEKITVYKETVVPFTAYRDELFSHLPSTFETNAAALQDLYVRITHGVDSTEFWRVMSGQLRSWAVTATNSGQLAQMASAVDKVDAVYKDGKHQPYYRVSWDNNPKDGGLKWQGQGTIQNPQIDKLTLWLQERSKTPSGGLDFKEPMDKKMDKRN